MRVELSELTRPICKHVFLAVGFTNVPSGDRVVIVIYTPKVIGFLRVAGYNGKQWHALLSKRLNKRIFHKVVGMNDEGHRHSTLISIVTYPAATKVTHVKTTPPKMLYKRSSQKLTDRVRFVEIVSLTI